MWTSLLQEHKNKFELPLVGAFDHSTTQLTTVFFKRLSQSVIEFSVISTFMCVCVFFKETQEKN